MDVFTKKSTSRRIINSKNIYRLEAGMHELSGMNSMYSVNVEVGKWNGEVINIRTHLVNIEEFGKKPTLVFVHGYGASSSFYWT